MDVATILPPSLRCLDRVTEVIFTILVLFDVGPTEIGLTAAGA